MSSAAEDQAPRLGPRPVAKKDAQGAEDLPAKVDGKGPAPRRAPEASPPGAADGKVVEGLRRQRLRRLARHLALFVLLPTLLGSVYFGFVAADLYESHAQFTVHSVESKGEGLDGLIGGLVGTGSRDTLIVRDHIRSRDMLAQLNEELDYVGRWQSPALDFIARLGSEASFEDAFEHYLDQTSVEYDSNSGVLTLRVRAPDAEGATQLAEAIIAHSEDRVNEMSMRERQDRTRYAEEQLEKAEARLTVARQALLQHRRANAELSPEAEAGASMSIRVSMETQLAQARAHLMELESYMTKDAPKVKTARERVKALAAQVGAEKSKIVDTKGEGGLAKSMADFEAAMVEKEFAEATYRSSLTTLELARADALRQHRYLAVIAAPSKPDESTYPVRGLGILTVFIMSFLLMGVGSLIIASVREHARV